MDEILVTAAGGTVGSAVVAELRAAGQPVRAGYHSADKARAAAISGQDAVALDLTDPGTLPPALAGVETVFLVSATGQDQTAHELAVVDAALRAGVRRVVKLSVWRADEQLTPIARLHRPAEEALERSRLAWTFLRPNFYMQNFSRQMAASIRDRGVFAQPESNAPISFVDARDVARVAAAVLASDDHDGRAYDVTGPQALTYDEAAVTLSQILRTPVRFAGLSDTEARTGMLQRGLSPFYADALIEVSRAYRDGGADRVATTVSDLTGRTPVSFAEFAADHRAVFS